MVAAAGQAGGGSGHRVAYDERDLETEEERLMPKLTLMEEVLLLGLKDKQVGTRRSQASFVCAKGREGTVPWPAAQSPLVCM